MNSGYSVRKFIVLLIAVSILIVDVTNSDSNSAEKSPDQAIVTKDEILTLFRVKGELDRYKRTYLWHCISEYDANDIQDINHDSCSNMGVFEMYVNGVSDNILVEPVFEYFPLAFIVIFSSDDHPLLRVRRAAIEISEKCSVYRMRNQTLSEKAFILHIRSRASNTDVRLCLLAGFLSYMAVPIRTYERPSNIAYYKFVYNFIASGEHELEAVLEDALRRVSSEGETVEIE